MHLAIFGATGKTGIHLVEQALAQGHTVAALARKPGKLGPLPAGLSIVPGDVLDPANVAQVIAGAEAVLSVLGPTRNNPALAVSQGMDNILTAMRSFGIRRLIVSAGAGVRDPLDRPTLLHAFFSTLVRILSKPVYADMVQFVDKVRATDLDWTVVRVPMLTNGPRSQQVWCGYVGKGMRPSISRADLAAFMLSQLTEPTYLRQAPAISSL